MYGWGYSLYDLKVPPKKSRDLKTETLQERRDHETGHLRPTEPERPEYRDTGTESLSDPSWTQGEGHVPTFQKVPVFDPVSITSGNE